MKKKSKAVVGFVDDLHDFIITNSQFRKDTKGKSETDIQREIRPLILRFLEKHFQNKGYADSEAKANKSFYWEGQEGKFGKERSATFASRNYPDFIVTEPYLLAIEYKQASSGSLVKQAIGQAIMHTLSGDFDYVYVLFHDQNKDKRITKSILNESEKSIISLIQRDFNVFLMFV